LTVSSDPGPAPAAVRPTRSQGLHMVKSGKVYTWSNPARFASGQFWQGLHLVKSSKGCTCSNPARFTPVQIRQGLHMVKSGKVYTWSNLAWFTPGNSGKLYTWSNRQIRLMCRPPAASAHAARVHPPSHPLLPPSHPRLIPRPISSPVTPPFSGHDGRDPGPAHVPAAVRSTNEFTMGQI
jgi:hypothetical protein